MKVTTIITTCSAVIVSAILAVSCVKQTGKEVAKEQTGFADKSFVQVYNGIVGSSRNYVYVDAVPVTGALLAFNSIFPSTSTPANFSIGNGLRAFLVKDTSSTILTQPPLSFAENLQNGKYYTIFLYDSVISPKKKIALNDVLIPSDTTSRVRFANFTFSPFAITAVDVYSKNLNANIFTNVSITDVTNYIPYESRRSDTLYLRPTGTTTNILNNNGTAAAPNYQPMQLIMTPTRLRSYTVIWKGSYRNDLNSSASSRNMILVASN
jgi:hypothetical protein